MNKVRQAVEAAEAIQGWKSREELEWMAGLATNAKIVLDIGCWRGQTTKLFSKAKHPYGYVLALDRQSGMYTGDTARNELIKSVGHTAIVQSFMENMVDELLRGQVRHIRADGYKARSRVTAAFMNCEADLCWIDGDHGYEDVVADILSYKALMADGGLLAGHDYEEAFPGVVRAVDLLCKGFERGPGSCWVYRT